MSAKHDAQVHDLKNQLSDKSLEYGGLLLAKKEGDEKSKREMEDKNSEIVALKEELRKLNQKHEVVIISNEEKDRQLETELKKIITIAEVDSSPTKAPVNTDNCDGNVNPSRKRKIDDADGAPDAKKKSL